MQERPVLRVIVSFGKLLLLEKSSPGWAFKKKKTFEVDGVTFVVYGVPSLKKSSLEEILNQNTNAFHEWAKLA